MLAFFFFYVKMVLHDTLTFVYTIIVGINLVKDETNIVYRFCIHKYGWVDERITGRRTEMRNKNHN